VTRRLVLVDSQIITQKKKTSFNLGAPAGLYSSARNNVSYIPPLGKPKGDGINF